MSLLLLGSLALNLWNNDFPMHYHGDEAKKVAFIETSKQDFHHPLLMLQVAGAMRVLFNGVDTIVLGRAITGLWGTVIVLLVFLIARMMLPGPYHWFAAFAVAVSPIVVIHAHYLKEDIVATGCILLALYCFLRFLEKDDGFRMALLGIATGLACAAQYKALLLFVLYGACPLIVSCRIRLPSVYYKKIGIVFLVSAGVFCLMNWPMLFDPGALLKGLRFESGHMYYGHDVRFYPLEELFTFHLRHSLVPGLTLPLVMLGGAYLVFAFFGWRSLAWQDRVLIACALLFYFSAEATTLKPFPDFMRYMVPVAPLMLYFACAMIQKISGLAHTAKARYGVWLFVIACLPSLHDTVMLNVRLTQDTRAVLETWIAQSGQKAIGEAYTLDKAGPHKVVSSLGLVDIDEARRSGVTYLIASSFMYERFLWGAQLRAQYPVIYSYHKQYQRIFAYPYFEIKPAFKSFAFSNPTIRVVRIDGF